MNGEEEETPGVVCLCDLEKQFEAAKLLNAGLRIGVG